MLINITKKDAEKIAHAQSVYKDEYGPLEPEENFNIKVDNKSLFIEDGWKCELNPEIDWNESV